MIAFRACSAFPRTRNPNHPTGNDFLFIALPIAAIEKPRSCAINSVPPAASLRTDEHYCSGNTTTSKRSFDTSIPQNESIAIFVSLPC
jgi:hypothetical protein